MNPIFAHFALTLALAFGMLAPGTAHAAASIVSFSPQGEVAQVRQVRVKFSEPAVQFGDPKAPTPFSIQCGEAGGGRWADGQNWVYDFVRDLPPGTRCAFKLKPEFRSVAGAEFSGKAAFQFNTGGPAVVRVNPYEGGNIDEDQVFVLIQNGAANAASIAQYAYCEAEGIHERIPVKLLGGPMRKQWLAQFAKDIDPERVTTLSCQQRLPSGAAVRLVWGKGIATESGIKLSQAQSFKFTVRPAFNAVFNCERENARAACVPLLPVSLSFSAPVSRKMAEAIVLNGADGKIKPELEDGSDFVTSVKFSPPFAEDSELRIELPRNFQDDSGRALSNAASFPLKARIATYPPLAKFAAAPFGIIELDADPSMPLTLRRVENALLMRSMQPGATLPQGKIANLKVDGDAAIIKWIARLEQTHRSDNYFGEEQDSRAVSLLKKESRAQTLTLPSENSDGKNGKENTRPFEVIGVPFKEAGYYVLELESPKLGAALLAKPKSMFVRTSALVTNLSVHIKLGRENSAVWVTTLDRAKPVADAIIAISDCLGKPLWHGKTGPNGVAIVAQTLNPQCETADSEKHITGLFVSARKTDEKGRADMAFALSSWNGGIEAYRFNLPTESDKSATVRAHTVFDRSLLRAGETLSMKHLIRTETMQGFALLAADRLPNRIRIVHQGSNQEFTFPLAWRGQRAAESVFQIPQQAKLGRYDVVLDRAEKGQPKTGDGEGDGEGGGYNRNSYNTGSFRVEEFRLPLLAGRITPPKGTLIAPKELPLDVQLNYLNGGGASGHAVKISAMLRAKTLDFPAYQEYSFRYGEDEAEQGPQKIVADKLALTLDKAGAGKTLIKDLPPIKAAQDLQTEMTFADPNGEIQTISASNTLWPSAAVVGVKVGSWVSVKKTLSVSAIALDTNGQPKAGVAIDINGVLKQSNSHRKRMVGGFYAYENEKTSEDLGTLCSGKTDARGLLLCEAKMKQAGNVEITAVAKTDGKSASAKTSAWVTHQGEIWFDGENQDRIDLLPEKKRYQPGDTALFQVRMPFRYATALVAIEREGVIDTFVAQLNGQDPTVSVPIKAGYGPNVFVSVLAVRGRMREVPWYSLFIWGWREPINWWHEYQEYVAPSAMVDLAKPAYKYGIAEIFVGTAAHQLAVSVTADKPSYPIRSTARVTLQVKLPNGKPAAGAEVSVAAVDEALLELQPNSSWNLLDAMLQRRSYGIETATAQMQVVGKRHYGRKAMPAGGSGGKSPSRELFDTLLLWKPSLVLDANGRAQIDVPLNDALTSFKIVAVAESGLALFGTGSTSISSTQDLQLIAGLPPLVREGDAFNALVTVRNTTKRNMQVNASAKVGGPGIDAAAISLAAVSLAIPAGEAREIVWPLSVPPDATQLKWEINAQEQGGEHVKDAVKLRQRVVPSVPVTVQQATLFQLDKPMSMPVMQPADSLPGRGGIAVALAPSLAGTSEGVRRYFAEYPYSCLEQKTSRAIGLRDDALWQRMVGELPSYLDADGLAHYYPPSEANARRGSDALTAYLLAASHEASFSLPDQSRDKMLAGLSAFVDGKITRDFWAPSKDLEVRKLAALEALSRYGQAQPRMLGSIQINPNVWPTSALLDWINILQRVTGIPERAKLAAEADQILRARLNFQGTRMGFSTETNDYWWWLMASADANANRLILTTLDNPAWQADMAKLVNGAIGRQARGHWATTTANVWGSLALEKFAAKFETEKVAGATRASLLATSQSHTWAASGGGKLHLPWPAGAGQDEAKPELKLAHDGKGKPWVTVQSLAAVPLKQAFSSGYRMSKTWVAVEQKEKGVYSRGDIFRVNVEIDAQTDMTWVVVTDPIPAGASLLGSGLGRDSALAGAGERKEGTAWAAYEERSFEAFRSYYEYVPKGKFTLSYTMRLNNPGVFNLPQTRAEAMYAPEMFGELPNGKVVVK